MFFKTAKQAAVEGEKVIRRFHTEPEYAGKAGHVQTALLQVNDYFCLDLDLWPRRSAAFGRYATGLHPGFGSRGAETHMDSLIHKTEHPKRNAIAVTDFQIIDCQEAVWYVLDLIEGLSSTTNFK